MLRVPSAQSLCTLLTLTATLAASAGLLAEEAANPSQRLVQEALRQEVYGDTADRDYLLKMALEKSPDYPTAMWHLGRVRVNDQWLTIGEAAQQQQNDLRLVRYRKLRSATEDTVEGHLALANWCAEQKLLDEERSHLMRMVELDSENAAARARLGYRMINGAWVSRQEQEASRAWAKNTAQALRQWKNEIGSIRDGLISTSRRRQETAQEKLAGIDDPSVIAPLEFVLSGVSEDCALAAVNKLACFKDLEATQSLARIAVFSPFELGRFRAAAKLRDRPQGHYVPMMLAAVYTPVESRTVLQQTSGGLLYRHLFFREGQNERQVAVLDTEYRPGYGDLGIIQGLSMEDIAATARQRQQLAGRQNAITEILNGRISAALSTATGESITEPTEWWQWWNKTNELVVADKGNRTWYQRSRYIVDDPTAPTGGSGEGETGGGGTVSPPTSYECLVRGTPVWTATGPVAIEKIQIGDRVLSQNPETGELTYKPVLRTTVRPAERLVKFKVDGEYIECSGGHPFWSPGKGWIKARGLAVNDRLHQATGAAIVESVDEGRFEPTYNLLVADFHTYFVGQGCTLSHDVTMRVPTTAVVPGLAAESDMTWQVLPFEPQKITATWPVSEVEASRR